MPTLRDFAKGGRDRLLMKDPCVSRRCFASSKGGFFLVRFAAFLCDLCGLAFPRLFAKDGLMGLSAALVTNVTCIGKAAMVIIFTGPSCLPITSADLFFCC